MDPASIADYGDYTSHQLERKLRRHDALVSMGSVVDCFDNAMAERVRDP